MKANPIILALVVGAMVCAGSYGFGWWLGTRGVYFFPAKSDKVESAPTAK